jgi:acetyl-CoA carboxylase biotin carboxyl carrier protein
MTTDSMPDTANGAVKPVRRSGAAATEREELLNWVTRHAAEVAAASPAPLQRIRITSGEVTVDVQWSADAPAQAYGPEAGGAAEPEAGQRTQTGGRGTAAPDGVVIAAPMVGTFYRSPEPGAAPFVEVGHTVEVGQQVGIVEAMKLMNPIQAEHAGRVHEILAADGAAVEYGEPLIVLVPREAID